MTPSFHARPKHIHRSSEREMHESEVAQSCPTLCDPINCSLPGSSVHGVFQARVLVWVAISFSRRSSPPRDQTWVSHIVDRRFTIWATRDGDTTLMEESEEELKSFLMRMNKESERAGLKLNINTYVMVLGPITSWKIEEEKVGGVTDFLFLGSKINAEGDCSHEIRCLLLGKKTMTNLDSVL